MTDTTALPMNVDDAIAIDHPNQPDHTINVMIELSGQKEDEFDSDAQFDPIDDVYIITVNDLTTAMRALDKCMKDINVWKESTYFYSFSVCSSYLLHYLFFLKPFNVHHFIK